MPVKAAGDFADGLAGGPDYWDVRGLSDEGRLNIRAEPSTASAIVGQVGEGTQLRNGGCQMTADVRWCRVEGNGLSGWAVGRYLRESVLPAPATEEPAEAASAPAAPAVAPTEPAPAAVAPVTAEPATAAPEEPAAAPKP